MLFEVFTGIDGDCYFLFYGLSIITLRMDDIVVFMGVIGVFGFS